MSLLVDPLAGSKTPQRPIAPISPPRFHPTTSRLQARTIANVTILTDTSIILVDYDVSSVSPVQTTCPRVNHGIELETLPLNFTSNNRNLSFHFDCTTVPDFATVIPCLGNEGTKRSCVNIIHPNTPDYDWGQTCDDGVVTTVLNVFRSPERLGTEFVDALRRGFELNLTTTTEYCYKCEESDGLCGYSHSTGSFMCFCSDGTSTRGDCKGTAFLIQLFNLVVTCCLLMCWATFIILLTASK
ncbi:kinase-like domain-containing protein [Tanacetum coccineum]